MRMILPIAMAMLMAACVHVPTDAEVSENCDAMVAAKLQMIEQAGADPTNYDAPSRRQKCMDEWQVYVKEAEENNQRARLAGAIFFGSMAGAGAGLTQASSQRSAYTESYNCSSDYECGGGQTCLKLPYSASGTCARVIDQYGSQVQYQPRLDSVSPGAPPSCYSAAECPIGFSCSQGRCWR